MLKIYEFFGCFSEYREIPCNGKGKIRKQISAYNNAAQYGFYFVITDLDDDYKCAPLLIKDWLPAQRSNQLLFRVAIHEIESWLLADRKNFATFFSISQDLIPLEPDMETDPKQVVISLAKRSRKKVIREAIVPIDEFVSNGPGYNVQFKDFIQKYWDIDSACKNSPSLERAIKLLDKIASQERSKSGGMKINKNQ
jgi:hypothetical protein